MTLLSTAPQPSNSSTDQSLLPSRAFPDQLTPESLRSVLPSPQEGDGKGSTEASTIASGKAGLSDHSLGGILRLHVPIVSPDTAYSARGTRSSIHQSCDVSLSRGLEPSVEEAEDCLQTFRTRMIQYSPFLVFPASTTAQQLRSDRPFLWLCIMGISSKSSTQQEAIDNEIRLIVAREMLMEAKSNLDLLLGLLTYIAWYYFPSQVIRHLMSP